MIKNQVKKLYSHLPGHIHLQDQLSTPDPLQCPRDTLAQSRFWGEAALSSATTALLNVNAAKMAIIDKTWMEQLGRNDVKRATVDMSPSLRTYSPTYHCFTPTDLQIKPAIQDEVHLCAPASAKGSIHD